MSTQGIYTVTNSLIFGAQANFTYLVPDDDGVINSRIIITGSAGSGPILLSPYPSDIGQPPDTNTLDAIVGAGTLRSSAKLAIAFEGRPIVIDWGPGPVLVAAGNTSSNSITVAALVTMVMIPKVLENANTLSAEDEG